MCPSASSTVSARRTAPGLPVMTVCTAALTLVATCTSSSRFASASRPVSVTKVPSWRHSLIEAAIRQYVVREPPAIPPAQQRGGGHRGRASAVAAAAPLHSTPSELENSLGHSPFRRRAVIDGGG